MARNESHGCSSKEKFEEKVSILIQGIINKKNIFNYLNNCLLSPTSFFLLSYFLLVAGCKLLYASR